MQTMQALQTACSNCNHCFLHETRTNVVFGAGNPHTDLMFVEKALVNRKTNKDNLLSVVLVNSWTPCSRFSISIVTISILQIL